MEQIFDRYRTIALLGLLLIGQLLLLAWQVRRPDAGGVRLLRVWSIEAIVPVEKASQWVIGGVRSFLSSYVALHQAEQQNQDLKRQIGQLRIANQELEEQVRAMPRLAGLLAFQQNYVNRTLEAEVIGSGATTNAQVIYLNRGRQDGVRRNMAVITPDGVVGKITQVFGGTSEVLLLTDPDSGVGAVLEQSRVHGILQGLGTGQMELRLIINDQKVQAGDVVLTSGEDQIYPKGLPLGKVISAEPGTMFQKVLVRPAARLSQLEEVLIITSRGNAAAGAAGESGAMTAAQIRQQQLPTIPEQSLVPRTGPPPPMAQIMDERRRAAIAAAQAANAQQQGKPPATPAQSAPTGGQTPVKATSGPPAAGHTSSPGVAPHPEPAKPKSATATATPATPPAGA